MYRLLIILTLQSTQHVQKDRVLHRPFYELLLDLDFLHFLTIIRLYLPQMCA